MSEHDPDRIYEYIKKHPLAVIGTIGEGKVPHGAVVYVCVIDKKEEVYFMTKNGTQKYKNLMDRPGLSLTIYDEERVSTLQARGTAELVREPEIIKDVFMQVSIAEGKLPEWLPPLAKLKAGAYVVFGVTLNNARLAEFRGHKFASEHFFTEL